MITADTITDEQIRELRADGPLALTRLCAEALSPARPGCTRRYHARKQCAALLNEREHAPQLDHVGGGWSPAQHVRRSA